MATLVILTEVRVFAPRFMGLKRGESDAVIRGTADQMYVATRDPDGGHCRTPVRWQPPTFIADHTELVVEVQDDFFTITARVPSDPDIQLCFEYSEGLQGVVVVLGVSIRQPAQVHELDPIGFGYHLVEGGYARLAWEFRRGARYSLELLGKLDDQGPWKGWLLELYRPGEGLCVDPDEELRLITFDGTSDIPDHEQEGGSVTWFDHAAIVRRENESPDLHTGFRELVARLPALPADVLDRDREPDSRIADLIFGAG